MNTWMTTLRLLAVLAVVALFYLLGRWLAETLESLSNGGLT